MSHETKEFLYIYAYPLERSCDLIAWRSAGTTMHCAFQTESKSSDGAKITGGDKISIIKQCRRLRCAFG